jgi:hypothetical protein
MRSSRAGLVGDALVAETGAARWRQRSAEYIGRVGPSGSERSRLSRTSCLRSDCPPICSLNGSCLERWKRSRRAGTAPMRALARRRNRVCVHSAARATSSTPATASPVSRTLHPLIVSTARMRSGCAAESRLRNSSTAIRCQTAVGSPHSTSVLRGCSTCRASSSSPSRCRKALRSCGQSSSRRLAAGGGALTHAGAGPRCSCHPMRGRRVLELLRFRRHLNGSGRKPGKERFRCPERGRRTPRSSAEKRSV